MKIGLLECDHIAPQYHLIAKDYSDMFQAFLPTVTFKLFDVCNGEFPESIDECDGWMCTGSKYSVYDEIDWITKLKSFVRDLYDNQRKFVGVCFGHQLLAEALGGKVRKNEKGWCVGVHEFEVCRQTNWMRPGHLNFNLLMMCQDQVFELPKGGSILAQSIDCKIGMMKVGETMMSIQAHPEFSKEYTQALMSDRVERIGISAVNKGLQSLKKEVDVELFRSWVLNFLA
jgi:GMP synthase-like glutamine amidotransferase